MGVEYLSHGLPLGDYQLTKADHRRQKEKVRIHGWVQRQVAKFPTSASGESRERLRQLLGPPVPAWKLHRWRLRLYCGHVIEATRIRSSPRPDEGICDKERCPECGLDPAVIVAFEPLGPVTDPPPETSPPE